MATYIKFSSDSNPIPYEIENLDIDINNSVTPKNPISINSWMININTKVWFKARNSQIRGGIYWTIAVEKSVPNTLKAAMLLLKGIT